MSIQTLKANLIIILFVCTLVLCVSSTITWLQIIYFKNYPYFWDPVSYSLRNINLYYQLLESNRVVLAWHEWISNPRCPLRTVPLILFNPYLLSNNVGYVATALPSLLIFLLVLGQTIYRRTQSLGFSLAVTTLFCAIPGLWNLTYGLGAYWLDLPAALLVGAAALALINFVETNLINWLILFSIFAACAALCRYIAIAYIFVACLPIIIIYLFEHQFWRQPFQSFFLPKLIAGLFPLTALAGYYLIAHFSSTYEYYTVYGYALNRDRVQSFLLTNQFLFSSFFGQSMSIAIAGICLLSILFFRKQLVENRTSLVVSAWYAVSIVLLVTAMGGAQALHSTFYAVPLIFFAAVSPISTSKLRVSNIWRRLRLFVIASLIIFAIFSLQQIIKQNLYVSHNPDKDATALKKLDVELAEVIALETHDKRTLTWQTYFDERAAMPAVEAFYMSGKLPVTPNQAIFTIHESYWKGLYPNLNSTELSHKIYEEAREHVDLAAAFADPNAAAKLRSWSNDYSKTVAVDMAKRLPKDSDWKNVASIDTQRYGKLVIYRNLSRQKLKP